VQLQIQHKRTVKPDIMPAKITAINAKIRSSANFPGSSLALITSSHLVEGRRAREKKKEEVKFNFIHVSPSPSTPIRSIKHVARNHLRRHTVAFYAYAPRCVEQGVVAYANGHYKRNYILNGDEIARVRHEHLNNLLPTHMLLKQCWCGI